MRILLVNLAFITLLTFAFSCSAQNQNSNDIVDIINDWNSTWKAEHSHVTNLSPSDAKRLLGALPDTEELPMKPTSSLAKGVVIPDSFDARQKWPKCTVIGRIRNQGSCGSCWAFATTSVMSDRICILTNGSQNVLLSPQHLISCCTNCRNGCKGGFTSTAWNYWVQNGVVTGGDYRSKEGCMSYAEDTYKDGNITECQKQCDNGSNLIFEEDLHKGARVYSIKNSVFEIKNEMMKNGPVCARMKVYSDFFYYKSGVYQHLTGNFSGYHVVKILGWGVFNKSMEYWLCANSWGTGWGEKGFFKIMTNLLELEFEDSVTGGIAKNITLK